MKKPISLIIIISIALTIHNAKAQKVVLEEDVLADSVTPIYGQNYKHFRHAYLTYGFVSSEDTPGSEIIYGLSRHMALGYRYKRKFTNFYALGFDASINSDAFHLKQNSSKSLPNDSIHESERLVFSYLKGEIYNRFNFGKRGNIIGKFIDLGVYANYNYRVKNISIDKLSDNEYNAGRMKQIFTGLDYYERTGYGMVARAGINRYVVFAQYRLSDAFEPAFNYEDLPKLILGFQVGLY
jgi:hypothetical protein